MAQRHSALKAGGRGSWFENWGAMGPKSSTNRGPLHRIGDIIPRIFI